MAKMRKRKRGELQQGQGAPRLVLPPGSRPSAVVQELMRRSPAQRAIVRSVLTRLQSLSQRVAASLRHHASDNVRRAASLVVIGALVLSTAACDETSTGDGGQPPGDQEVEVVPTQELTAEVAEGLPTATNQTYAVKLDSIARDQRGVYYFDWFDAQRQSYRAASASKLQLVQSDDNRAQLTMSAQGEPVLAMPADTPVALVWPKQADEIESATEKTPQPTISASAVATNTVNSRPSYLGSQYYPYGYHGAHWYPFYIGGMGSTYTTDPTASRPAYRDPPSGVAVEGNQPLRGSVSSTTPKPLSERTVHGVAVSGKARGTGPGVAVTGKTTTAGGKSAIVSGKAGGTGGTSGLKSSGSSGSSGAKSPSSSGFSGGKAGSSGGSASS